MSLPTPISSDDSATDAEAAAALRLGAVILLSLLGLGGLVLGYSLGVEPFRLQLTRPRLVCPRLPAELDGLRILFLTDPHVQHWGRQEEGLMAMLSSLPEEPEMIVWGGDLRGSYEGMSATIRLCERVRKRFRPEIPILTVLGNAEHKMSARQRAVFVARLEATGMTVLINRQIALAPREGAPAITIAGVDDPYYGHDRLADTLKPCPPSSGRFTLLLSHSPQLAVRAAKAGVDVMLSGHTHGGQVRLPLIGPLKTQNPLAKRMDAGLWDRRRLRRVLGRDPGGDLLTYISRGIGVAPLWKFHRIRPRLLCRPEVALITLHRPGANGLSASQ